jgi:hypothetical protein
MLIPAYFYIGTIRLSPYRVLLLILFAPSFIAWMSGKLGGIRTADILILLSALWGGLAIAVNNGIDAAVQPGGILLVETFGSYLLARRYICNAASFATMARTTFWAIVCLIPFAADESLTGDAPILDLVGKVVSTFPKHYMDPRYGLERAMVVFEHPILYGTFCTSAFGLAYYVLGYREPTIKRLLRVGLVTLASVFSVSTGAAAAIAVQLFFMSWNFFGKNLKSKWNILGLIVIIVYISIDTLSNRTPFHVFVTYLTFSTDSAYGRILIWDYGTAEVARHPIFGIGLNDWVRPSWMSGSMDNFWLVIAVVYGLPAFFLFSGGILLILRDVVRAKLRDEKLKAYRQGLLISWAGLIIAGGTVHYWNAIYCWFVFLIGSGVWMTGGKRYEPRARKTQESTPGLGPNSTNSPELKRV